MTCPVMQRAYINGVALELQDRGSGEPVIFVHGSMGDECAAILTQPLLAETYRLIHYHRRGYGESECPERPVSIVQQSADCQAVMRHVGVERAHMVGQSYGAVVLLQVALDAPDMVHSLTLIEPPLPSVLFSSLAFNGMVAKIMLLYAAGQKVEALDAFAQSVISADYRRVFDQNLPSGAFDRWVADVDMIFQSDLPALQTWQFTEAEALRISQPVLNMAGANSASFLRDVHNTLQRWWPHAEAFVMANVSHSLMQMNPQGTAERLASFFSRHAF